MEIEFSLAKDDVLAFYRHHYTHFANPGRGRLIIAAAVLVIVLVFNGFIVFMELSRGRKPVVPLAVLFFLLIWLVYLIRLRPVDLVIRHIRKRFRRGELTHALESRKLSITPAGVQSVTEQSGSIVKWPSVVRIVVTESHAFIYVNPDSAHILPKDAFAQEFEFEEFVETAKRYHEAAKPAITHSDSDTER